MSSFPGLTKGTAKASFNQRSTFNGNPPAKKNSPHAQHSHTMKIKTRIKAGKLSGTNHNETIVAWH